MSEKHKKVCVALNYFEYFLIFVSAVSWWVKISAFASLVGVPIGVSAVGIKIWAITALIKYYKSVIKKKRKKHDKVVLLTKTKLDTIEILISKALINSYINYYKFLSVNVFRKYN